MTAAQIISQSITGQFNKEIVLGDRTFKIYQPTINELCLIFGNDNQTLTESQKRIELMAQMGDLDGCVETMANIVSFRDGYRDKTAKYIKHNATLQQIAEGFRAFNDIVNAKDLLDVVQRDEVRQTDPAAFVGGKSLYGIITSFMENLHLTYKEVTEDIPYPVLIMMNVDKLRVLSSNEKLIQRISGKDLANRRRK